MTEQAMNDNDDATERYNRAFANLTNSVLSMKRERDRFAAALHKIVNWKGYTARIHTHNDEGEPVSVISRYEEGANDMLETLQMIAKEALE